jgi:hypothetical protein
MPFADGFLYTHYRLTWLEPCYGKSHRKASLESEGGKGRSDHRDTISSFREVSQERGLDIAWRRELVRPSVRSACNKPAMKTAF